MGADTEERRCTSDDRDDSACAPLVLGGGPAASVVDRQEVSFRARVILSKTRLMKLATSDALR